jgi:hypothetical protein
LQHPGCNHQLPGVFNPVALQGQALGDTAFAGASPANTYDFLKQGDRNHV